LITSNKLVNFLCVCLSAFFELQASRENIYFTYFQQISFFQYISMNLRLKLLKRHLFWWCWYANLAFLLLWTRRTFSGLSTYFCKPDFVWTDWKIKQVSGLSRHSKWVWKELKCLFWASAWCIFSLMKTFIKCLPTRSRGYF